MTGIVGLTLTAAAVVVIGASPAAAQRFNHAEASLGGMIPTSMSPAALYLSGGVAMLPTTSLIGEVQVVSVNATEFVALGGVRQRLSRSSQAETFAQLLFGAATGFSRRCGLCRARVAELGLGANVTLNDRWAVNVRGDMRLGGSAGDLFYLTLGGGITRRWGYR